MKPTRKKPLRRAEVLECHEDALDSTRVIGTWKPIKFKNIRKGDIFRLFDLNDAGEEQADQVDRHGNHVVNVALTDAEPQPMPMLGVVHCEPLLGFYKER